MLFVLVQVAFPVPDMVFDTLTVFGGQEIPNRQNSKTQTELENNLFKTLSGAAACHRLSLTEVIVPNALTIKMLDVRNNA